jgi:hypothetical protein
MMNDEWRAAIGETLRGRCFVYSSFEISHFGASAAASGLAHIKLCVLAISAPPGVRMMSFHATG